MIRAQLSFISRSLLEIDTILFQERGLAKLRHQRQKLNQNCKTNVVTLLLGGNQHVEINLFSI